jgi:hypothetical protein
MLLKDILNIFNNLKINDDYKTVNIDKNGKFYNFTENGTEYIFNINKKIILIFNDYPEFLYQDDKYYEIEKINIMILFNNNIKYLWNYNGDIWQSQQYKYLQNNSHIYTENEFIYKLTVILKNLSKV